MMKRMRRNERLLSSKVDFLIGLILHKFIKNSLPKLTSDSFGEHEKVKGVGFIKMFEK